MQKERLSTQEGARQKAVLLFEKVREVPYKLGLDGDPTKLFRDGYGNCVRKLLYMAPRLGLLDYKVTSVGVAIFDWKDLRVPKATLRLLSDQYDLHPFLYIKNHNGEEIQIDNSWDSKMPEGFRKLNWDGESSTGIGVQPIDMYKENIGMLSVRVLMSVVAAGARKISGNKRDTPFNDAINKWLGR